MYKPPSTEEKIFYEEIENQVVDIFVAKGYKKDVLDGAIYAHRKPSKEMDISTNSAVLKKNLLRAREATLRFIDTTKEAESRAEKASKQLDAVFNSHSWRFTKPLRLLGRILQWCLSLPFRFISWVKQQIKKMLRPVVVKVLKAIQYQPGIKARVNALLKRFPSIHARLKMISINSGVFSQPNRYREASSQTQVQDGYEKEWRDRKSIEQFVPVYNIDVFIGRIYEEVKLCKKNSDIESIAKHE